MPTLERCVKSTQLGRRELGESSNSAENVALREEISARRPVYFRAETAPMSGEIATCRLPEDECGDADHRNRKYSRERPLALR